MITLKWRKGHDHRILDVRGKRDRYILTVSFDHSARAGCYSPQVKLYTRNRTKGIQLRRWDVPYISWRTGYKWRKWGGLVAYRINYRLIHLIFARHHGWYNKS